MIGVAWSAPGLCFLATNSVTTISTIVVICPSLESWQNQSYHTPPLPLLVSFICHKFSMHDSSSNNHSHYCLHQSTYLSFERSIVHGNIAHILAMATPPIFQTYLMIVTFNEWNYLQWAQFIRHILKGTSKLNHIEGEVVSLDNPNFQIWNNDESRIITWQ